MLRSIPRPKTAVALSLSAVVLLASYARSAQAAQPPVGLGTASSFAVLAGSAVTNTGPSVLTGDLGVSPGTAITGFPAGQVNGTMHSADAVAGQAKADLTTAYNDAAGRTPATAIAGDIGGLTLTPGVYKSTSSVLLTGDVILNAGGDPNAVFIFQIGSTLTTATGSRVQLINGANACNVFWQIGSSATIGTTTAFRGTMLALTSITATTTATIDGRLLARNGAVTLDTNTITRGGCETTSPTVPVSGSGGSTGGGSQGTSGTAGAAPGAGSAVLSHGRCVGGRFRAVVTGTMVKRVVFTLGGLTVGTRTQAPFSVFVQTRGGSRTVIAHITYKDSTPAADLKLRFRACAQPAATTPARPRKPRQPPSFTG